MQLPKSFEEKREFLEFWHVRVNRPGFIPLDPIEIPHRYSKKQDIEIAGFFASIMAWGQRKTIINKATDLLGRMDNDPFAFVLNAKPSDLKRLEGFVHRTMNDTDVLYLLEVLKQWYLKHDSLESAFTSEMNDGTIKSGLIGFYNHVFSLPFAPNRTKKHIANPAKQSACKRLNMYLRWMVRSDNNGVDFGLWKEIKPSQLICPLDVHVIRVAQKLGMAKELKANWNGAETLTEELRKYDERDPVKYDFALFGLGVEGIL